MTRLEIEVGEIVLRDLPAASGTPTGSARSSSSGWPRLAEGHAAPDRIVGAPEVTRPGRPRGPGGPAGLERREAAHRTSGCPVSRTPATDRPPPARRPRPVSRPHDPAETQADRAAEVVARGGSVSGWSFGSVPPEATVHRDEKGAPAKDEEKLKEAAKKTGEAALETKAGKALQEKVKETPVVKAATKFLDTTAGKVVAGGAIAAGAGALAAAKQPLPFQAPAIPLDKVTPGLSAKVTVEGPLNAPTFVGLSLTYKEQGPKGKGGPTEKEQIAADIARLRAQQDMFKPRAQKQQEQADEQAAIAQHAGPAVEAVRHQHAAPGRPGWQAEDR